MRREIVASVLLKTHLNWLIVLIVLRCLGDAVVGRRTSDLAVMGSGVIGHLGQLSLPSLRR